MCSVYLISYIYKRVVLSDTIFDEYLIQYNIYNVG